MTGEEVTRIIDKALDRDYTIFKIRGRREKLELYFLLNFMYYSHLKMVDVLKLTPKQVNSEGGWFYNDRYKKIMGFEMNSYDRDNEFFSLLDATIRADEKGEDDFIITRKRRALIYAFKQIAAENGIENCRITDVLYAGERDNAEIRKPYIIEDIDSFMARQQKH